MLLSGPPLQTGVRHDGSTMLVCEGHVCGRPHHLADIVSPRQEQDAGVVLLPVRQNEREEHHPQDVVERGHAHAAFPSTEYGVDGSHKKDAGPTVQAMVKELPQWGGGVGSASLFAIHAVYRQQKIKSHRILRRLSCPLG